MNGYIAQRRGRFYVVIYEGRDPVTGKEQPRWHPAGTDRTEAERLAKKLAAEANRRVESVRSLTFGAYLTSQWLPAKKLHLATSTYRGYERKRAPPRPPDPGSDRTAAVALPTDRIALRLAPPPGNREGPVTQDGVRDPPAHPQRPPDAHRRGLVTRNVALVARAPKQRALQKTKDRPGPTSNSECSCAPQRDTGSSRSCGSPP